MNAPSIKAFFDFKTDTPPVFEFNYVHSHFVPVNFVSELEKVILVAAEYMLQTTHSPNVVSRLQSLSEKYAEQVSKLSQSESKTNTELVKQILMTCRDLWGICNNVIKASEVKLNKSNRK
jgi:hypothetical protein